MNVARDAAGDISVTNAIGKNDAGDIITARKDRGEIATGVSARWNGDNVSLQACELERSVGFLIAGPELHTAEGTSSRGGAWNRFGIEFLEFHERPYANTGKSNIVASAFVLDVVGMAELVVVRFAEMNSATWRGIEWRLVGCPKSGQAFPQVVRHRFFEVRARLQVLANERVIGIWCGMRPAQLERVRFELQGYRRGEAGGHGDYGDRDVR